MTADPILTGSVEVTHVAPAAAICTMDATGRLTFAGEPGYIHALQAAIAERYFAIEPADKG